MKNRPDIELSKTQSKNNNLFYSNLILFFTDGFFIKSDKDHYTFNNQSNFSISIY